MSVLRRANPRTRGGIRALHTAARLAASPAVQTVMKTVGKRLGRTATDELKLPDYAQVRTTHQRLSAAVGLRSNRREVCAEEHE